MLGARIGAQAGKSVVNGNQAARVFVIDAGATVSLDSLVIENGTVAGRENPAFGLTP